MEFRNCPSCKASVLEDDVEDCPFCGALMSGKPSAKPAAGPAKSPAAGATKPTAPSAKGPVAQAATPEKSPSAGSARPRPLRDEEPEKPADDADPFEVDPLAHKQAAQVSVKAGKGRTIEVKCPMCETSGFIAPSQAGKDVKCCNPSCKLPIFKSPKLPEEVKAEPEKAKGLSGWVLAIIGLVVVAAAGGIYYFVLREVPKPIVGPISDGPVNPDGLAPEIKNVPNVVVLEVTKEVTTVAEIRQLALDDILKVTGQQDIRSKPYGLQLAAEAKLAVGDLAGAIGLIGKMGPVGDQYAVEPMAILAHMQLDAGDKAAAEVSLNKAVTMAAKLRDDVGRSPLDAAAILAAALIRVEKNQEAIDLLKRFTGKDLEGRATLSEMWRASLDQGSFDFAKQSTLSHLELCGNPLWVSTTVQLCRYGQWDTAMKWARSAPDVMTQDASQAAFSGMLTARLFRTPEPALEAQLKAAIESAGLTAKVRMQVAAAEVRLMAGDKGVTSATVAEIELLLAATQIPPAAEIPDMKAIYDSKGLPFAGLPNPGPGTSLAFAWADIADLQMKLGDTEGGWATQGKAMDMLRSVSPSPGIAQHLVDQCESNEAVVINQLSMILKLGNDRAKKGRALSQYRVQCNEILKLASNRFSLQQTLLRRSIRYGLFSEVWAFSQESEQGELARIEPYRSNSSLLTDLYYSARAVGNETFATQVYSEYTEEEKKPIKQAAGTVGKLASATFAARAGDPRKAAETLKPLYVGNLVDRHLIDHHVLVLVGELAAQSIPSTYTYIQRLADPTIREDSMRLLAGLTIIRGQGPELWKLIANDREIKATDKAAAYLGFLEGIQASGAK